jgi:hypothetical protein
MLPHMVVAERIRKAFCELPIPTEAELCDEPVTADAIEATHDFRGKHWSELDVATLVGHYDALYFFGPTAFQFYLPAFLLAALYHYYEADPMSEAVVFRLMPRDKEARLDEYFDARRRRFSPEQRDAIGRFLEAVRNWYQGEGDELSDERIASVWS